MLVKNPLVVVSLTTLPSRYNVLENCIKYLSNQTYPVSQIYITIPKISKRLNIPYPPIQKSILDNPLCKIVHSEIDYGPITKIYGGLVSVTDPNTLIFVCDDDVEIKPNHIQEMVKSHLLYPNDVISGTASKIGLGDTILKGVAIHFNVCTPFDVRGVFGFKNGSLVDIPFGVGTYLFPRKNFPTNETLHDEIFKYVDHSNNIFVNDDILVGAYLNKNKIKIRVFTTIPFVPINFNVSDALSQNFFVSQKTLNNAVKELKKLGFFTTTEQVSVYETLLFKSIFLIFIVLIFILLITYFKYNPFINPLY